MPNRVSMTARTPERDVAALTEVGRQRQNRRLLIVTVALTVLPLVGVLVALAVREPAVQLSPLAVLLILALVFTGPLLGLALVAGARRRGAAWVQPSPLMALDWRTRRQLVRTIRRGNPIEPSDREVASHLVAQIRRARWTPLMCSAPLLLQAIYLGRGGFAGTLALIAVPVGVCLCGWSFYVHHKIASRTDL
jgi:hypothetical protein